MVSVCSILGSQKFDGKSVSGHLEWKKLANYAVKSDMWCFTGFWGPMSTHAYSLCHSVAFSRPMWTLSLCISARLQFGMTRSWPLSGGCRICVRCRIIRADGSWALMSTSFPPSRGSCFRGCSRGQKCPPRESGRVTKWSSQQDWPSWRAIKTSTDRAMEQDL